MVKRSPPLFDPDALSLEELWNVFTDREDLLQKMEDAINRFIKDGSRRHLLLVGERGVGKSTLLRFLEKDFEKRYSKKKALISLLFTDYKCLHDAQDLGDILMRITAELYRIKGIPIEVKHTVRLEEKLEIVEKRLEKCGINNKIILMVENLQNLMEMRPRETGFEGMRAFVENHKNILLIGTATEIPKSMWKYKSRFWAFFDILSVEPLSEKHFLDMMERMARHYDGKILLDKDGKLRKEISLKIRSIYHLVSGYPRLGVSLYEVLVLEEPQEVAKSFDSMLDNLSPYFEGIDAKLSMQERYVFGQIVRKISPNISNANFSFEEVFEKGPEKERGRNRALFSKLKKKGFLTVHHKEGRRVYHRLSNPIFGIWYLKTHVKGAAVEGRHILEFIHAYYTIEEFVERFGDLSISEMVTAPVKAAFGSLKEEYIPTATALGIRLARSGELEEALDKFEKVIAAARRKKDDEAEAIGWIYKGDTFSSLGRYQEALSVYDKALELNPKEVAAWNNKGNVLNALGKYREALGLYDKALELNPEKYGVWNNKGNVLSALGKNHEALEAYDKALEINSKDASLWNNKGNTLRDIGRCQEAMEALNKALKLNPKLAQAWYNKGNILGDLGKYQEALEAYEEALKINKKYAKAWINKGNALYYLGKYQESLEAYEKALGIDPEDALVWFNKGDVLKELKRYQEALDAFDKALEINPKDSGAWYNKGNTLRKLRRFKEALEAYNKALEINPKDFEAWNNKGNILRDIGRHQEAIGAFDQALEISPRFALAYNNKGLTLKILGRHQEALAEYEKSLTFASENNEWPIVYVARTNRIITLVEGGLSLNIREELGTLLENFGKGGANTEIRVYFLLSIFRALIRKEKIVLIHEVLQTIEEFEEGLPSEKTIYPSFEPVKLAAEYLEIVTKSPKKGKEVLEKAAPHLRKEAKMLLGIAEN